MQKKLILNSTLLDITLERLCRQLIENHNTFANTAIIGLQPRGIHLAKMLYRKLKKKVGKDILFGHLDATFHRDDFRRRDVPVVANETLLDFSVEGKKVVLIDDVLCTGRTVRAAMDAIIAFGRPIKIELMVLVDRKYCRDLPIEADYVGTYVHTLASQKVWVELREEKQKNNKIWLLNHN